MVRSEAVSDEIIEQFPELLPRDQASRFRRYIDAHEEELDDFDGDIIAVIATKQIDHATGNDLDKIGALFGDLGQRQGRTDNNYRSYLKSLVQSFEGRGTVPGLKFAIAAGIGTSPDNITINEDFDKNGYTIVIENVDTDFITGVINDLADLADPSAVELLQPPILISDSKNIDITKTESQIVSSTTGLGGGTLTMDGNSQLG